MLHTSTFATTAAVLQQSCSSVLSDVGIASESTVRVVSFQRCSPPWLRGTCGMVLRVNRANVHACCAGMRPSAALCSSYLPTTPNAFAELWCITLSLTECSPLTDKDLYDGSNHAAEKLWTPKVL